MLHLTRLKTSYEKFFRLKNCIVLNYIEKDHFNYFETNKTAEQRNISVNVL